MTPRVTVQLPPLSGTFCTRLSSCVKVVLSWQICRVLSLEYIEIFPAHLPVPGPLLPTMGFAVGTGAGVLATDWLLPEFTELGLPGPSPLPQATIVMAAAKHETATETPTQRGDFIHSLLEELSSSPIVKERTNLLMITSLSYKVKIHDDFMY